MFYHSKHQRMKPVLNLARQLDIATNPHPSAVFEAGNGGIQIWCTPQGRNGISLLPSTFSKPCEYVGRSRHVYYCIVSLNVEIQHFSISKYMGNGRL